MRIDREWAKKTLSELINTDSPTGYYIDINELMKKKIVELGYTYKTDNRNNIYVHVKGNVSGQGIYIVTHLDTIGLMVSGINSDGSLNVHHIGGINYNNLDGTYVTVLTRQGQKKTGICCCKSHSTHTFPDARDLARKEENMRVFLDERVSSRQDVVDIGVRNGDWIAVSPEIRFTENDYIKSRFLDDKVGVLCSLYLLKTIKEESVVPNSDIMFVFSNYEEIGQSGSKIPSEFTRIIALDVAPLSPYNESAEDKVTIISNDHGMVYDLCLTNSIIDLAKQKNIDFALDSYYRYSTDAETALKAGNDIAAAAMGLGVFGTHGVERTHFESIDSTCSLLKEIIISL